MKRKPTRKSGNRKSRPESSRGNIGYLLVALLAVPALIYIVYATSGSIFCSSLFKIKSVTADDPDLDISYFCGRNIFTVSLSEIAAITKNDPWISGLTVHRTFPDSLHVSVIRRIPFAYLNLPNRRCLVTRDGVIVPEEKYTDLPALEIYGLTPGGLPGEIAPAVSVFDYCRSFLPVQSISFSPDFLTLALSTGETIFLPKESLAEKLPVLYRLFAEFRQKGLIYKYLDLRFDDPVFLPVSQKRDE